MMTEEQAFSALSVRLGEARQKHPVFAQGAFDAFAVIREEFTEFRDAVGYESEQRQIDEALDVAATCLRFVMGEHHAC